MYRGDDDSDWAVDLLAVPGQGECVVASRGRDDAMLSLIGFEVHQRVSGASF